MIDKKSATAIFEDFRILIGIDPFRPEHLTAVYNKINSRGWDNKRLKESLNYVADHGTMKGVDIYSAIIIADKIINTGCACDGFKELEKSPILSREDREAGANYLKTILSKLSNKMDINNIDMEEA